jgi:hypothetical protein
MSRWSDAAVRVNASQLRAFGEDVTYRTAAGAGEPVSLTVVWSDAPEGAPKGVSASAWCLASALSEYRLAKNDVIRRGNSEYWVVDDLPKVIDGGLTILLKFKSHASDA